MLINIADVLWRIDCRAVPRARYFYVTVAVGKLRRNDRRSRGKRATSGRLASPFIAEKLSRVLSFFGTFAFSYVRDVRDWWSRTGGAGLLLFRGWSYFKGSLGYWICWIRGKLCDLFKGVNCNCIGMYRDIAGRNSDVEICTKSLGIGD